MPDSADPRLARAWDDFCAALARARRIPLAADAPDSPCDRAEGFRYLTRFLAAGVAQCVAWADADHPVFGRMIDYTMPWGLDNPDTLYLFAAVRGDASYRIFGGRGSANHIDIQVNFGHFANGDIGSWGTISSCDGFELECEDDGSFELTLSPERRPGNWLAIAPGAEFVLVRQYFNDWERERPADLFIERIGAAHPIPRPTPEQVAERLERLATWLEKGGALWENMSRGLLSGVPNSLVVHLPKDSDQRAGMRGQAYGMGNFQCGEAEAVIVEFTPPPCHHWSVSLANWWWEAVEYASRQSSLNGHQARLAPDGAFRAVIAHADPGVANWLDTGGNTRGTLAARFLRADAAPVPNLRRVAFADLARELPADTPRVDARERAALLARRRRAVLRRFRW